LDTPKADEVLQAVRADIMSGLSIGFEPVKHTETKGPNRTPPNSRDLHERTEVRLREVSVCNFPAYDDAAVTGIRATQARHPTNPPGRPPVAALAASRGQNWAVRTGHVDRFNRVVRR
jgi:phage head maturation protease